MKLRVGDLAFLPSSSQIEQHDGSKDKHLKRFTLTQMPKYVLVVEEDSEYYGIIYAGEKWRTLKRFLHIIQEKEID